mmetsp:Transcript_27599/g.68808  ORF Transcript_27599/g.68808 Transcript_27599/m.68808 type:complete len:244 (-) Transcript_27599:374-1105(-)
MGRRSRSPHRSDAPSSPLGSLLLWLASWLLSTVSSAFLHQPRRSLLSHRRQLAAFRSPHSVRRRRPPSSPLSAAHSDEYDGGEDDSSRWPPNDRAEDLTFSNYRQRLKPPNLNVPIEKDPGKEGLLNVRFSERSIRGKRVREYNMLPFDLLEKILNNPPQMRYVGRYRLHPLTTPGDILVQEDGSSYRVEHVTHHYDYSGGAYKLVKKTLRVQSKGRYEKEKMLRRMFHNANDAAGGAGGAHK